MTERAADPLPPGSTIGILGGGQLGRMTAHAAQQLGYRCHIFCPEADCPGSQVTAHTTTAAYDDEAALLEFARAADVISFEFENIPLKTAEFLDQHALVRPSPKVLAICQNRLREKDFCRDNKVPTTRYAEVRDPEAFARVVRDIGVPAVLKTVEMGYDGKGQVAVHSDKDLDAVWQDFKGQAAEPIGIVEAFVDFRTEISVIVARGSNGTVASYVPVENQHKNHILDQTIAPARVAPRIAERAEVIGRHLGEAIGLVGLLAIEMFVTQDDEVLVNELAPRPHNSGHWTLDACTTSQFEQFVRAIAGLPLASTYRHSDAVMRNLIGDDVDRWREFAAEPGAKLHLYGKAEARPGRKMGHVTRVVPKP